MPSEPRGGSTSADNPLIFAVDDEQHNLDLIGRVLRGYRLRLFVDSEEAFKQALVEKPDVLILDYRMPDLTGVDMLRSLREAGLNSRALMVTAYPELDEVVYAEQMELVYRIIPKPFRSGYLIHQLRLVLAEVVVDAEFESKSAYHRIHELVPETNPDPNARYALRIPVRGKVTLNIGGDPVVLELVDLSVGGLCVVGDVQLQANQAVVVTEIEIEERPFPLAAAAKVSWVKTVDNKMHVGLNYAPDAVSWESIAPMIRRAYVALMAAHDDPAGDA